MANGEAPISDELLKTVVVASSARKVILQLKE